MGPFIEANAFFIQLAGLLIALIGCLWLLVRTFRFGPHHRGKMRVPLYLLILGCLIAFVPPAFVGLAPVDLGPRERIVDGERHITLTGWDRKDYALLGSKHDTVVLQMANPDVTDATLVNLKGMDSLKELDLSRSQVTDAGLDIIKALPALKTLRLAHTKITDMGFKAALANKESLVQLDLQGTGVNRETVQAWKSAKPGRRALQ